MYRYLTIARNINPQFNYRKYSHAFSKKFYEIPYDEQYECRDFLRNKGLTINNFLSDDMKNILSKIDPENYEHLTYSNKKYTCKTKEEHEYQKNYPLG